MNDSLASPSLSERQVEPATGLSFLVHEPAGPAQGLLVLSHGVGGNETNLVSLLPWLPPGWRVVFVRSALALGPGQYAWFAVQFGPRGPQIDAAQADAARGRLAAFIGHMQARFGTPPARTVVAGFSQGGILSASVGLTRPEAVAGFGLLSGRILPELEPVLAPRERLSGVRGFVAHGRLDDKLPLGWAERAHAWLDRLGVPHELHLYDMGHGLSEAEIGDFATWLRTFE